MEYLRPRLDVYLVEAFAAEAFRQRPDVAISDRTKVAVGAVAWVEIPTGLDAVSRICVGGKCRTPRNPSFTELLSVLDEAETLTGPPDAWGSTARSSHPAPGSGAYDDPRRV